MTILGFVFVSTIMRLSHPPKLWYSLTFWEVEWYNLVETVENKHYVHLWRGGGVASHVETVLLSWQYVVVVVGGHWPLSDTSGHHHQVHLRHNTLMTLSLHVSTTYVSSLLHSYVISDHFIYNGTLSVSVVPLIFYRVSHKKLYLVLEGCSTPKFWARNKSQWCFGILRFSAFQICPYFWLLTQYKAEIFEVEDTRGHC